MGVVLAGLFLSVTGNVLAIYGIVLQRRDSRTGEALVRCEQSLSVCDQSRNAWIAALIALVIFAFVVGRYSRTV